MTPRAGVNVRNTRGSGHAPGSYRVVAGDDGRAIGGREWCQRRSYASQPGVAMNMSKQRLHTRDERPAVQHERRRVAPPGASGGGAGQCGVNKLNADALPAKCRVTLHRGDVLTIETPGGGGWG